MGDDQDAEAATRRPQVRRGREAPREPGTEPVGSKPKSRAKSRAARRLPAGRHGLSREDVTNSQRQRLLDAMASVSARRTYAATTIAEVVESAGVSRATFYELFRDKEDCFVATMDDWIRMLAAAIQPVIYAERDGTGWPGKVRDVVTALLDFIAAKPDHATAAIVEALGAGERAFARYRPPPICWSHSSTRDARSWTDGPTPPSGTARAIVGGGESPGRRRARQRTRRARPGAASGHPLPRADPVHGPGGRSAATPPRRATTERPRGSPASTFREPVPSPDRARH